MAPDRRSERVEQRRRRKIPLACEPCRERKSRCDGAKPICSTCQRRSLPLHCCVYTLENARTASNEAYIRVLHDRIRRLERTCVEHGIPTPPLGSGDVGESETLGDGAVPSREARSSPPSSAIRPTIRALSTPTQARGIRDDGASPALRHTLAVASPDHERLDATESAASITAMGTVSTDDDACQVFEATDEFYGSSSAASFMKEACTSVKPHRRGHHHEVALQGTSVPAFSVNFARSDAHGQTLFSQPDKFVLPPRGLADHLLSRFWDRVYWLYPFFHKPTFLKAYESLWRPAHERSGQTPPPAGLGLGSAPGAEAGTIVYHCALNTIFALGAQFSDLCPKDKASTIETFFHRAKAFVGLDFIDMHNLGVVQSLLLMALLLQSTPFPSRCWNGVGLACRVAEGLGLHTESGRTSRPPLETEIRRRTWHGCVVLDMIVSMTYGRPTMSAHVPDLPLPGTVELDEDREETGVSRSLSHGQPSKMSFYVEFIRQHRILGEILSNVYQPPSGTLLAHGSLSSWEEHKSHGMDAILQLDAKLSRYENGLPPIMSWKTPCDLDAVDEKRRLVIATQRAVLRGSFLYLRLMLHRPILTQLCANSESSPNTCASSPAPHAAPSAAGQELFTSFAAGCARICLGAAMDLIELVHSIYQTNTTGGWWWDGLYAFTAGLVIILVHLCPDIMASLDSQRLERCWAMCQGILAHFASFSISAHRSLKLLRKVHADVLSRVSSSDKDGDLPPRPPSGFGAGVQYPADAAAAATGLAHEDASSVQAAAADINNNMPMDLARSFQWQFPGGVGADVLSAGLLSHWDLSLETIASGFGVDLAQSS